MSQSRLRLHLQRHIEPILARQGFCETRAALREKTGLLKKVSLPVCHYCEVYGGIESRPLIYGAQVATLAPVPLKQRPMSLSASLDAPPSRAE